MSRKKPHPEHENHERWLVSYADFITLLFAFFVVMFASSQTDKAKAKQVSDSVKEAIENGGIKATVKEVLGGTVDQNGKGNAQLRGPGGVQKVKNPPHPDENSGSEAPPPSPVPVVAPAAVAAVELIPSMKFLTKELDSAIREGKVDVHLEPRGLVVSLRAAAFFPSGTDAIAPETFSTIQKIAGTIQKLPNPVRLEGHTDSIPIHTARYRSNWDLSAARAIAMMNLLTSNFGLPTKRFAIAGYADTAPREPNDTPEGRAHNRRVDIVILNQQALISEPGQAPAAGKPSPVGQPAAAAPAPRKP